MKTMICKLAFAGLMGVTGSVQAQTPQPSDLLPPAQSSQVATPAVTIPPPPPAPAVASPAPGAVETANAVTPAAAQTPAPAPAPVPSPAPPAVLTPKLGIEQPVLAPAPYRTMNGRPVNGNGLHVNGFNGNGGPEPIKDNSFFIEEAYNQEPGVVQHILNWFGRKNSGSSEFSESAFIYTMELPIHSVCHQFSFNIPYETFFDGVIEQGGLGDVQLNYRYQLFEETDDQPAVAPRFSLILPTGDEDRGMGTGELGFQFNLPVSKTFDQFAVHFNAGFTYIPDVSVPVGFGFTSPGRDLHGYNLGASGIWLAQENFNLMLELVAFWDDELDAFGNRDRITDILLVPGFRWAVYTRDELQWVVGLGLPIGLSHDAPDIGIFAYMSVEHPFRD